MPSFFRRWLSARPAAPKIIRPRFRPTLHPLDDRITPTFGFAVNVDFATGSNPLAVAVADFNGDGRPDLVTANNGAGNASVLLNATEAGTNALAFATKVDLALSDPRAVAVADVNGDGRPDVVVVNDSANTASVLLNSTAAGATSPTFAAKQDFATGSNPYAVAVADVNGDGRPDLVTANHTAGTMSVLLNITAVGATAPTFAAKQDFVTDTGPFAVTVADVNGDGRLDLVTANSLANTASVRLNTTASGATALSFAAKVDLATGLGPASVTAADVNGDGRPDLIVADYSAGTASVLLNTTAAGTTAPSFAAKVDFGTGSNPYGTVADVNGDGRPDLVTANYGAGTASVLLNNTVAGATVPTFVAKQDFATGSNPRAVVVADMNADGRPDLVAASFGANTVSVLLNNTTDAFAATTPALVGQFGTTGIWGYNRATGAWVNLDTRNAIALATDPNGNAVASFGMDGVWYYRPSTGTWTQINGYYANAVAMDQFGNAFANFTVSNGTTQAYGTFVYRATGSGTGSWVQLGTSGAGTGQLVVSANGDVVANFVGYGIYRYRTTTGWQQINGHNAIALAGDPNGYVVASFEGFGIGRYIPYANGWQLLAFDTAAAVAVDGFGNVTASFGGGFGIGRWSAATTSWVSLAPSSATATALAMDLFGNVWMSLTGFGVYEYNPLTGWVQRRAAGASVLVLGR